jgi:2-methylcitrate dehydratase PrpD
MATPAEGLCEFTDRLTYDRIPTEVIRSAKLRILDILGICLASSTQEFAKGAVDAVAQWGGTPESTVVGFGLRLPAPSAVLANGVLAHGLDFDDTHAESVTHASAAVIPAALAVGEARGASGQAVLAATVAGLEAVARIGMAAPGRFHAHGFHATSICGTFAAALVAAKLSGLAPRQMVNALGVCGSQASGIFEYLADGSWVKRFHPGWSGHAGVVAAAFAERGFTGPRTIFEGRFGLYRAFLGDEPVQLDRLTAGLGTTWETLRITFKPYPCCHLTHAFIDCVLALRQAHRIRAEEIEAVECRIAPGEVPIVCEPSEAKSRPRTPYDAQFSLPFVAAVALMDGEVGLESFSDARIRDTGTLALASRVRYANDPASTYPRAFPGALTVRLRDGRELSHAAPHNRGSVEWPLTDEEILAKFRSNAGRALSPAQVERLEAAVLALEACPDVRGLIAGR